VRLKVSMRISIGNAREVPRTADAGDGGAQVAGGELKRALLMRRT
jgi:hypothetical protein